MRKLRWFLRSTFVVACATALAPSARADQSLLLAGVARANGVSNTRFVSTVWLYNPSGADLPVDLGLITSGGRAAAGVHIVLAARETRRLDDPVGASFGLESAAGTLTARSPGALVLRGVTANVADPRGSYGLALATNLEGDALFPGETGVAPWLSNTAAAGTGFRSNVAVTLLEPGSDAVITLLDDTGLVRGEERITSPEPVFWQRSVAEIASDPEIPLGRLEVRVARGSAVAYAAVVDNVTGDGILAPARRLDGSGGLPLLVPGAARTPGANGTLWRTGLRLVNPSQAATVVALEGVGLPGAARSTRSLAPEGVLEEADILGALGLPEGSAGAVLVTSGARMPALAATRNVDPSGRPGTFAAAQELVPIDTLAGPQQTLVFAGLSSDAGTAGSRTNLAFVSGGSGASGRLVLRAPSGAPVAEGRFALSASSWTQRALTDWLGGVAIPRDSTAEVNVESGTVAAYASVVDNGTGDPVVLSPAAVPVSPCPALEQPATLSASAARVTAGSSLTLRLDAPGRSAGRVVPGDIPLGPGESVAVSPAVTTTYRWLSPPGCPGDASAPVTVDVLAPAGAVMTEQGAVRGVTSGGAVSFRGIPFAAPPTGAMRWRPPARAAAFPGVRDGSAFGPVCPQLGDNGAVSGAEDCLALNVWTPATAPAAPLPVLLFIHGGGNVQGAGSVPAYDGTSWAQTGRAVVVTVNYRLSAFGWLAQPFLSAESLRGVSGNWGIVDQLAALRWVKRNAAAFGGDPSRVTIFGESAGGVNVCTLVASPFGKGLFARALIESGGCAQRPLADFVTFGSTIVEKAGCAAAVDPAACLRALPFEKVLLAVPPTVSITSSSGQLWGPAVDGFVLPTSPDVALARGTHNKVPFAIGSNADETGQAAPAIATEADYRALVTAQFGPLAPLVLAKYPASAYQTPRKAYVAVTTDSRFVCPSRRFARGASSGGSEKVFRYFFSYPANKVFGAVHGSEIPFVFGTFSAIAGYTPDASALALSQAMNASWARFAATGDPNDAGAQTWPLYDAAADRTLTWDAPSRSVDGIRTSECDFWDSLTPH